DFESILSDQEAFSQKCKFCTLCSTLRDLIESLTRPSEIHKLAPPHPPPLKHVPYIPPVHLPRPPRRLRRLRRRDPPRRRQPPLLFRSLPPPRNLPGPHRRLREIPRRRRLRRPTRLPRRRLR